MMLQVDPTKRIRIDDLLRHRWLLNNVYPEPVKWESIYQVELARPDSWFAHENILVEFLEQTRCIVHPWNGSLLQSNGQWYCSRTRVCMWEKCLSPMSEWRTWCFFRNATITWQQRILSCSISNLDTNPFVSYPTCLNRLTAVPSIASQTAQPVRSLRISFERKIKRPQRARAQLTDILHQPIFFSSLNKIKPISHRPAARNRPFHLRMTTDNIDIIKLRTKKMWRTLIHDVMIERHRPPSQYQISPGPNENAAVCFEEHPIVNEFWCLPNHPVAPDEPVKRKEVWRHNLPGNTSSPYFSFARSSYQCFQIFRWWSRRW